MNAVRLRSYCIIPAQYAYIMMFLLLGGIDWEEDGVMETMKQMVDHEQQPIYHHLRH